MSNRDHAHELIDRLPETQLSALVGLLETIVDPVATALHNARSTTRQHRAAVRSRPPLRSIPTFRLPLRRSSGGLNCTCW
jgi:hypothetical protein